MKSPELIKASFKTNDRITAKIMKDETVPVLYNDSVFKTLLTEARNFYQKASTHLGQVVTRCCEDPAWAVKETCFDHLVTLLDLLEKLFEKVVHSDFKFLLAQVY